MKTIIIPSTVFAIASTLSGPVLTTNSAPSVLGVAKRIPVAAFWAWINFLPTAIDNQRQQDSIAEDTANKAWRPLPSKRLTPEVARHVMFFAYLSAFLSSLYLGGTRQSVACVFLGCWYNNLRGGDDSCIIRNLINACAYICMTSGTLQVMLNNSVVSKTSSLSVAFDIGPGSLDHSSRAGHVRSSR